jgi:hypothetical protein
VKIRRSIRAFGLSVALALGLVWAQAQAGGSAPGLLPGGGPTKSDCYAETAIEGITVPSDRVQKNRTVLVTDGESGDQGPCGDEKCAVRTGICINQNDPNLPDCTPPAGLDAVSVKGKISIEVPDLLTGSACGGFVDIEVPTKIKRDKDGNIKKAKSGKVKFKVKAKGPKGTTPRNDVDNVTLVCVPRTVECPASPSGAFLD